MATRPADSGAPARWCRAPTASSAGVARPPTRGRSTLEPASGEPIVRARPVHDALRVRRRRGADLDQRRPDPTRPSCTRSAPSAVTRRSAPCGPATVSACAAPSARLAGDDGRGRRRRHRRRRHRPRAAAPALYHVLATGALRPRRAPLRRAHPRRHALSPRARALASASASRSQCTVDTARPSGAATSASSRADRARRFDPGSRGDGLRARDHDALPVRALEARGWRPERSTSRWSAT